MNNSGEYFFKNAEKNRVSAKYDRALGLYKKALKFFKRNNDVTGVLNCFISIADTLRAKGDFIKAQTY